MRAGQRSGILLVLCIALAGCGAARAVSTTGKAFDRFGCLARDFKPGEPPCPPEEQN